MHEENWWDPWVINNHFHSSRHILNLWSQSRPNKHQNKNKLTTKWVNKQSKECITICTFLAWYKLPILSKSNKKNNAWRQWINSKSSFPYKIKKLNKETVLHHFKMIPNQNGKQNNKESQSMSNLITIFFLQVSWSKPSLKLWTLFLYK